MLLALDTATRTASLALYELEEDRLLAEETWLAHRRQTQDLLPTAQRILERQGVGPEQVTALAVTTGPGSFTGVRIAISVAKGMALGLASGPRLLGLPTLSVTAAPWLRVAITCDPPPLVVAFIQAGRGRYNWATFSPADLLHRPGAEEHRAGPLPDFVRALEATQQPLWLVGEEDPALAQAVRALPQVTLLDGALSWRRGGHLAWLAARHFAAGHRDSLDSLRPLYLNTL